MASERKLRVGIDVGGTFTDVVAIDATTRRLVAAVKVPTTHAATEGVAAGIVAAIERLLLNRALGVQLATRGRRLMEEEFDIRRTTQRRRAIFQAAQGVGAEVVHGVG